MRTDELHAVGDSAARAFRGGVDHVQNTHRAIARRVFGATAKGTPAAGPVGRIHDGIADGVYAAVRGIGTAAIQGSARGATVVRPPGDDLGPLSDRPIGDALLGALNGAFGARFAEQDSPLELQMTLRVKGRDVAGRPGVPAPRVPPPQRPRRDPRPRALHDRRRVGARRRRGRLLRPAPAPRPRLRRAQPPLQQRPPDPPERRGARQPARAARRRVARRRARPGADRALDGRPRRPLRLRGRPPRPATAGSSR